jgi:hypothetical protein
MKFSEMLFSKILKTDHDYLFGDIIGYDHIKRLFRMALNADCAIHVLLVGPPASAKTMFLTSLMQLKNSYFADGAHSTKAGMIDYLFENKPRFLLIDEADKMAPKDQALLLNLMETGIVSETKCGKTRSAQIKTSVLATSNNTKCLSAPLLSRFFVVKQGDRNNNKMERLNGEVRDREKVMRGLKKADTPILPGYQLYHNYFRPHMALKGKTPAEVCGIEITGDNKWKTVIQNAKVFSSEAP